MKILPIEIAQCFNLRKIDISENLVKNIPECIYALESIEDLNLEDNYISAVDHNISRISLSLKVLLLAKNPIDKISESLVSC